MKTAVSENVRSVSVFAMFILKLLSMASKKPVESSL